MEHANHVHQTSSHEEVHRCLGCHHGVHGAGYLLLDRSRRLRCGIILELLFHTVTEVQRFFVNEEVAGYRSLRPEQLFISEFDSNRVALACFNIRRYLKRLCNDQLNDQLTISE